MQRRVGWSALIGLATAATVGGLWLASPRDDQADGPAAPVDGVVIVAPDPVPWGDITWERLDPPSMGGRLSQSPTAIEQVPGGFIVLGSDADGIDGAEQQVGTIWTSSDGRSWEQDRITDGVPPGDIAEPRLAAGGPGGVLVAGGICCSMEGPAMWLAQGVGPLERVQLPPAVRNAWFTDIEAGPPGFVVVGATKAGDPNDPDFTGAIWTSPDGVEWSTVDPVAAGLVPGTVDDVTWTGRDWIAVGKHDDGKTSDGAVWRSDDGVTWRRIALDDPAITGPEEESLTRVVSLADGGLFAQGGSGTHDDRVACENLLGDVVGVPGASLVLSCGWEIETHWTSPDGRTWTRAPAVAAPFDGPPLPPAPGGRRLISHRALAPGGPGLVVVDAEGTTPEGHDLVGTWVSGDGATWRPVGEAGQIPGAYLQDLVVTGRTIVGIAERVTGNADRSEIAVWVGTVRP